jgi:hypothetical protein
VLVEIGEEELKEGKKNHQGEGGGAPMKWTPEVLDALADKLLVWMKEEKNFWLGDFAVENDMWRAQLDELSNTDRSPKFTDAIKKAKTIQESKLVKLGMSKKYNPAMAIFALKNVAGWRDVQDINTFNKTRIEIVTSIPRPELSKVAVDEEGALHNGNNGNGVH